MARTSAYPVELVQNFSDALRNTRLREDAPKAPAPTDMMILRALLAHPLTEPQARNINESVSGSDRAPLQ